MLRSITSARFVLNVSHFTSVYSYDYINKLYKEIQLFRSRKFLSIKTFMSADNEQTPQGYRFSFRSNARALRNLENFRNLSPIRFPKRNVSENILSSVPYYRCVPSSDTNLSSNWYWLEFEVVGHTKQLGKVSVCQQPEIQSECDIWTLRVLRVASNLESQCISMRSLQSHLVSSHQSNRNIFHLKSVSYLP